ncbi:TonB-dependent receptor, partial [Mycobacterium tuberculosis]|nr:TonB-dependent receptor [Mycobacterium tuberculosis]
TIAGLEAEGQFFVLPNLVLSGQLGYVHGRYRNIRFDISGDGIINDVDRDLKLPRLSPWTSTIAGLEAEGQFFVLPNLVLSGQLGYVHGRYRN